MVFIFYFILFYLYGCEVPRLGLGRGLILAWMQRSYLRVVHESPHLIHIDVTDNKGKPLSIIFVYGHPELGKRNEVWQRLKTLKDIAQPSWLCIGDFNQVLSREEKFSFHQNPIAGVELFHQVLSDLYLCDLMATGQQFTWMNKREEESFVMERLDTAFASTEWINQYHLYYLRNLPIIKSDHGPIILDFEHQTPFRNRPVRFEHMWITHPSCRDMVS